MAINQYRLCYFQAVYNHGKIRKAADYLNPDSSVVTRQIGLLEEEIGYQLFERCPRGGAPTGAAESLLKVSLVLLSYHACAASYHSGK